MLAIGFYFISLAIIFKLLNPINRCNCILKNIRQQISFSRGYLRTFSPFHDCDKIFIPIEFKRSFQRHLGKVQSFKHIEIMTGLQLMRKCIDSSAKKNYYSKKIKQRFKHSILIKYVSSQLQVKFMNQRSKSALRKMKTDLGDEHAFEKKIARAIKDKKQYISKMTTPRSYQPTRNYSSLNPNIAKPQKNIEVAHCSKEKQRVIHIQREFVQSIQEKGSFGNFTCINHPKKKGSFEDSEHRDNFYCHECAISLVKSNVQVMGISSESLIVKMFLQEQLERITEEEMKAKSLIEQYYACLRESFSNLYKESHYSLSKNEVIEFGNFEINEYINKLTENLGKIQICHLKFDPEHEKQNLPNSQPRESIDRYFYKLNKDRSADPKTESNRSLESNPQKNSSFLRSRDNSFYKKGSKVDIPKTNKLDSKKGFYLR